MPFLIIFGAGIIVLGMSYIIVTIRVRLSAQGIANWPKVVGTVVQSGIYRHERRTESETSVTYTPTVVYTYALEDQTYTASKRTLSPYYEASYQSAGRAQAALTACSPGDTVDVYYNPAAPQQAVLEKPKAIAHNAVVWYGIVISIVGSGAIILALLLG